MTVPSPGSRFDVKPVVILGSLLLPAFAAIWLTPCFLTQDGPAHLYNAEILRSSANPTSPYRSAFAVRRLPLPNWAGHLLDIALVATFSPKNAERAHATIGLFALSAATLWLRLRVAGSRGVLGSAALAALLGLNVAWLFGFTSFLLGAALFPIALAVWWDGRDEFTWKRTSALAVLSVFAYFCHPVGLGLTAFALVVLALVTPGTHRAERFVRTLLGLAPMLPLGAIYKSLTREGGPMRPEWAHLDNLLSLRSWVKQLGWVDPISLAGKVYRPFSAVPSGLNALFAPVFWLSFGVILIAIAGRRSSDPIRRGFGIVGALLLIAGALGPDTLGTAHGHYLPQRIVLLGLVALVPWLRFEAAGRLAKLGRASIFAALVLQSLFVWDYALESARRAGPIVDSFEAVGRNTRVATVLLDVRGRFRSNPLLHADCLLGIGTGNIIWSDYETTYYYFPVQLRDPDHSPPASAFEAIARLDDPRSAEERADLWRSLLDRHAQRFDVVLIQGTDPKIERITTEKGFDSHIDESRSVRLWSRKNPIGMRTSGNP